MLYFSEDVNKYVKSLIPKMTLNYNYKIIGSFGKSKYITDIDVTNYIDDNVDYIQKIRQNINNLPEKILFLNFIFHKLYFCSLIDQTNSIEYFKTVF